MKVALLITTYNRPGYLKQCFDSLKLADLGLLNELMIVDDASTDPETKSLMDNFNVKNIYPNLKVGFSVRHVNSGIKSSLLTGYKHLFKNNDIVINLDSDAIVRKDFLPRLIEAYKKEVKDKILTGFHSTTMNANGTERHKIIKELPGVYLKQSVGGINMCLDYSAFEKYVESALLVNGNWDHNACINAGGAYCLKESVIEHIGFDSSMNHTEQPDIAHNFYFHDLKSVTLMCVDGRGGTYISNPINKCLERLKFGHVVEYSDGDLNSIEKYSEFIIKHAYHLVKTSHCLIVQSDGYVINPMVWDDSWLQYDYIGATWWYQDGHNVGNGGFSLRSNRLMEICATDPNIKLLHPEDHHICRTYRNYLESTYNIKFAPEDVADKFSYEGYMQPHKQLGSQFGFHGKRNEATANIITHSTATIANVPGRKKTGITYIPNQFRGLGDILFLVPLMRALMDEGHDIIWPIHPEYMSIAKHFPDLDMRDMRTLPINYDVAGVQNTHYGKVLPYRFAMENMGRGMIDCMRSKYDLYGHSHLMWRNLSFKRFSDQEDKLAMYLDIDLSKPFKYQLVNRYYGEASKGFEIKPELNPNLPVVEMRTIEGFTLIDWCGIIENASEIHTANTSLLYLLEILHLEMPIHFYRRGLWSEVAYEHTDYLYTKPYILH